MTFNTHSADEKEVADEVISEGWRTLQKSSAGFKSLDLAADAAVPLHPIYVLGGVGNEGSFCGWEKVIVASGQPVALSALQISRELHFGGANRGKVCNACVDAYRFACRNENFSRFIQVRAPEFYSEALFLDVGDDFRVVPFLLGGEIPKDFAMITLSQFYGDISKISLEFHRLKERTSNSQIKKIEDGPGLGM